MQHGAPLSYQKAGEKKKKREKKGREEKELRKVDGVILIFWSLTGNPMLPPLLEAQCASVLAMVTAGIASSIADTHRANDIGI